VSLQWYGSSTQHNVIVLCFVVAKEENEERMMVDPSSREDPKVKELLQVGCMLCNVFMLL